MQSESSKTSWHKGDTLQLIKLIGEYKSPGTDKINNDLFIQVANKMFEYGISRTYIQCKNKWKEIVDCYNEYNKTKLGEEPPFYSELSKVLCENDASNEGLNPFGSPWSQYETTFLIKAMKVGNFIHKLKTEEPLNVYEQISQYLQKVGPLNRSKGDIQQRWKNLKQSYIKYIKGDLLHFKYFEVMDALLDWEPNSIAFEEDQFKDGHEYGDEKYQNPDDYEIKGTPSSKRALNWTHKETEILLEVVQKYNLKRMRRDDISAVFDEASVQLRLQGYKRSAEQCRVKFKHLKVKYLAALKKTVENENPERYFYHFDKMKEIMQSEVETDGNSDLTQDEQYEIEYLEDEEGYEKVVQNSKYSSKHNRKGRVIWSQTETKYLLNLLKVKNVKRYCRRQTFEEIALEMSKAGYKRSSQMCMIKWKNLRNQLYSCIRNMVDGKEELCPFYDEICEIVQKNGQVDISLISDHDQEEEEEEQDHDEFDDEEEEEVFEEEKVELKRALDQEEEEKEVKRVKNCETNTESIEVEERLVCNFKMDDVEHYCMSLASTFKRLNKRKQAKLKIEIQELLYRAEFDDNF